MATKPKIVPKKSGEKPRAEDFPNEEPIIETREPVETGKSSPIARQETPASDAANNGQEGGNGELTESNYGRTLQEAKNRWSD